MRLKLCEGRSGSLPDSRPPTEPGPFQADERGWGMVFVFFFFFPFSFKVTNKFLSLQGRASTLVETFNVYISSNSSE